MSFIETLRNARSSRVSVLHEFLTQYDPRKRRIHAFFEGHDDVSYFVPQIEARLPKDFRVIAYRCDGKPRVYDAYRDVTARLPDVQSCLFFVDKDLDDVLGTPWPADPRIYVTDVYSIENYFVSEDVLLRFFRSAVRLNGVAFDESPIAAHFGAQLKRFQRQMLCVMAWILVVRRQGGRPLLNEVDMRRLCTLSDAGEPRSRFGERMAHLSATTRAAAGGARIALIRAARRELARMNAKRAVRGKFELWYFVEYWKRLTEHVRRVAREGGGSVSFRIALDHGNAILVLAPLVPQPTQLTRFLGAHLARFSEERSLPSIPKRKGLREWFTANLFRRKPPPNS